MARGMSLLRLLSHLREFRVERLKLHPERAFYQPSQLLRILRSGDRATEFGTFWMKTDKTQYVYSGAQSRTLPPRATMTATGKRIFAFSDLRPAIGGTLIAPTVQRMPSISELLAIWLRKPTMTVTAKPISPFIARRPEFGTYFKAVTFKPARNFSESKAIK